MLAQRAPFPSISQILGIPRNLKEVRSFLGLTSYYRKFIYKYADKAKALHKITEKNQKFTAIGTTSFLTWAPA
jgi:hypothetical protein